MAGANMGGRVNGGVEPAGAANLADLIKLLGRDKATVGKCMAYFQDETPKLPILEGQRDKKARKNMTVAREKQLSSV